MRSTFGLITVVLSTVIIGCDTPMEEPEPIIEREADEGSMEIMLNGKTFSVGGAPYRVLADDIQNLVVVETTENDDDSFTSDVSFEFEQDKGTRFAIEATVHYTRREMKVRGGAIALYPDVTVETKSGKRINIK